MSALGVLRDQVIAPILAGVGKPRHDRKPVHWTKVDLAYQALRVDMRTLFHGLGNSA